MPPQSNSPGSAQRQPLGKAIQILELLADLLPNEGGVREIAAALRIPATTAHRTLRNLEAEGIVESNGQTGRYRVAPRFLKLAWTATTRYPLTSSALPLMQELVDAVDETAFLALYDRRRMEMTLAAKVDSSHPLQYVIELNRWLPVYAGAGGLGIMSFLPAEERRAIIQSTRLRPITEWTETDPAELERLMARFRKQGYARTIGQRVPDAVGMSAPVWSADGRVVGDVVLTIPNQRFTNSMEPGLAAQVIACAGQISAAINGHPPASFDEIEGAQQ